MKALVLEENGVITFGEVPDPEKPTEDSVLIRITHTGVCGSDLHRAFEAGAYHYPLIMGHEMAGVVAGNQDSSAFHADDRVAIFPLLPCYRCGPCQTGDYAQCEDYDYFGSRRHGGFAEYLYVPEANLVPVPDHVSQDHAAMTEPCAVALHGVRRLDIVAGQSAAIYGAGPIGNMVAQWLRFAGCRPVTLIDIDEGKLALAAEMGFQTIQGNIEDPVSCIRDGGGAAVVVEAVGLPQTFLQAIQSADRLGQVLFMGNIAGEFRVGEKDFSQILRKELRILGTWNSRITPRGSDDWSTVLDALDRDISVGPLISHRPPLKDGPHVLRRMHEHDGAFNKVIFAIHQP